MLSLTGVMARQRDLRVPRAMDTLQHRSDDLLREEVGKRFLVGHRGNLLDKRTGNMGQFPIGDHNKRLDARREAAVGHHHGQFRRNVRDRPDTANHNLRAAFFNKFDRQPLIRNDFDIGEVGRRKPDQLRSLLCGEQGLLLAVDAHADNKMIEQAAGPLDNVEMPKGKRIKRSGIDGPRFHTQGEELQ